MICPATTEPAVYRPRQPQASPLFPLVEQHYGAFRDAYPERYQPRYGPWRPEIDKAVRAYLRCGDLREGFARVHCPDCGQDLFVAFSCHGRGLCPSCHQKRALLTGAHVAEDVCAPVPHRQFVCTMPRNLRTYFRRDRRLLAAGGAADPIPAGPPEPSRRLRCPAPCRPVHAHNAGPSSSAASTRPILSAVPTVAAG